MNIKAVVAFGVGFIVCDIATYMIHKKKFNRLHEQIHGLKMDRKYMAVKLDEYNVPKHDFDQIALNYYEV